jgi:molybdopterin guanine dinucleotide-containing S/N-oxide reductase-like protein
MKTKQIQYALTIFFLEKLIKIAAARSKSFKQRIQTAPDFIAQIRLKDNSQGRHYIFENGRLRSRNGIHPKPDIQMIMESVELACKLMSPSVKPIDMVNAMKEAQVDIVGPGHLTQWFTETLNRAQLPISDYGIDMGNGTKRYVNCTNGGAVHVDVKDGKILRIIPIEFDDSDAKSWTIDARGRKFTPPRKTALSSYSHASKSVIYSKNRLLYPMKRVDFDPNGNRNHENRGVSGYERISWEEALDLVADEIMRVKSKHGQGAILSSNGSHHMWGNLGYWLSAFKRFLNLIGHTPTIQNPDSWEGWYWGASNHWGYSMRLGGGESYGLVEDALKECEMIVFWSSDPESTSGVYAGMEGTIRRLWAKELGIKFVHIDPHYNHTAALLGGKWLAPRPATGNALALAIAYVWITEDSYDKDFIAKRTTGFDEWKAYLLGKEDGIPKTPEWQEGESAIPAKDVRALAREWASKKTYLSAGGPGNNVGGACRSSTGIEWARSMVCLMAMQGIGKPGVNMGNLQAGTPVDRGFCFPGYAEGGMSGSYLDTGLAVRMMNRMPNIPTINPSFQKVPRQLLPEAILEGKAETWGNPMSPFSIESQFEKFNYPEPGHSLVKMYYKYGGSFIGTQSETNRYVKAYRTDKLEFVVNQSIWFEGEAKFADVILPACTNFERWDISESSNCGGYVQDSFTQLNHRVITMQHKCIEPLGESKSDYDIFQELANRLGIGPVFSEGNSAFDWCKRMFDASDLPDKISWKKFLKKGYFVVPAPPEALRSPVSYKAFAEGRTKDTPDLGPLPGDYNGKFGMGLQTQSGKFEFVSSSLKRFDPNDPERPVMTKYIPSWEGHHTKELFDKYPLLLISPHPRYSFHTHNDAKDSYTNDIKNHRVLVDGYYYWIVRINTHDAERRNIKNNDLVKVYNARGTVICAAQVTERVQQGTTHSYESSAKYDPIGEPGNSPDRGGCINLLTSKRPIIKKSHSTSAMTCLVEIELWEGLK